MNCELLAVGTEILLGNIVDTHSQYMSRRLADLGIGVYYHTSVGDNVQRLTETLRLAFSRSDLVILSGGLGPTTDDLTKEVTCEVMGVPCAYDQKALDNIESYFSRTGRTMTQNNKKQALCPIGATIFYNDHGTAPGMAITKDNKTAILLPGPPRELLPMFETSVVPYLRQKTNTTFVSKNLMVFGIGESTLETKIADIVAQSNPTAALYAKDGEVLIRLTQSMEQGSNDPAKLDATIAEIQSRIGDCLYGVDITSLEQAVVPLLAQKGLHIATAESCTGGLVGERITGVSGASAVYECGIISYSNEIKHQILGVRQDSLLTYGAVSKQVAQEMALGVAKLAHAQVGVGITGIAGPTGGTAQKPVGTVFVSVSYQGKTWTKKLLLGHNRADEREYIRKLSAMNALNMVRLLLLDSDQVEYD